MESWKYRPTLPAAHHAPPYWEPSSLLFLTFSRQPAKMVSFIFALFSLQAVLSLTLKFISYLILIGKITSGALHVHYC